MFLFVFQITSTSRLIQDTRILKMNLSLDKAGNSYVSVNIGFIWFWFKKISSQFQFNLVSLEKGVSKAKVFKKSMNQIWWF